MVPLLTVAVAAAAAVEAANEAHLVAAPRLQQPLGSRARARAGCRCIADTSRRQLRLTRLLLLLLHVLSLLRPLYRACSRLTPLVPPFSRCRRCSGRADPLCPRR